jgi:hypothetical protein
MISFLRDLMASDNNVNRPFPSLLLLGIVDFCCILIGLERIDSGKVFSGTIWIVVGVGSGLIGYYWPQIRLWFSDNRRWVIYSVLTLVLLLSVVGIYRHYYRNPVTAPSAVSPPTTKVLAPCPPDATIDVCNADNAKITNNHVLNGNVKVNNGNSPEISGNDIRNMAGSFHDVYERGRKLSDECQRRTMTIPYQIVLSDADLRNQIIGWKRNVPSVLEGDDLKQWAATFGNRQASRESLNTLCQDVDYNGDRMTFLRNLTLAKQRSESDSPTGNAGVIAENGSDLTMRDNQVSGYKNGVHVSHSKSDIEHNNIQASPHPLTQPPLPIGNLPTLGPRIRGLSITNPGIDLPQNPIPVGEIKSNLSLDEQKRIISSLAIQWKQEHGGAPARRLAFHWINEQLEQQNRDFRVEIPKDCPSAPNAPNVGVYVVPGATGQLNGDQIQGFQNGVVSGQHAVTNINGTSVASDCD